MGEKITIILCSDNHGLEEPLRYLKQTYPQADYFIHCGDSEMSKEMLAGFASVQGNNDPYGEYPTKLILEIGKHRIYLSHGNRDMFFGNYEMIAHKARIEGCDVALFGHSHVPYANVIDGITCINPGSIWHNRDGSTPTYMILTLEDDKISWEKKEYKR